MKLRFRVAMPTIPACAVLAVALLAIAAPARAQDPARVQLELSRTDLRIERAGELLARTPNALAQSFLDNARQIEARAQTAFGARQYDIALRLTIEARGFADRSISVLQGLPDPNRVTAQLERTREVIERARDRLADCTLDRPRFLLQVASAMEQRAEDAATEERFLAALQLTMSARERALRALRLCNLEENARDVSERALRRTDEILVRAQDVVGDSSSEQARQALNQANAFQAEAHREFTAGHYEPCLRLTQQARTIAYRAIRLAGGTP